MAALGAALDLHKTAPMQARHELDFERASILLNRGNVLLARGQTAEALKEFEEAVALHEGPTVGPWIPLNSSRCRLYASMSHL
ncbi:MAG: tetratricopeptide repeat protein, partial [Pseudomonadota bacterium]